ncbi:unnamed protein product [Symbiodinium sp. CCMP2592]|nr:unnamed protein product [Symbiodinium sp. CCMP2592]
MSNCLKGIGTFCSRGKKEEAQPLADQAASTASAKQAPFQVTTSDGTQAKQTPKTAEAPASTKAPEVAVCEKAKQGETKPGGPGGTPAPAAPAAAAAPKAASSQAQKPERRRAPDGRAYTYSDFVKYFGKKQGEMQWTYARRV